MNGKRFRAARESFLKHQRPFDDPEEYHNAIAAIEKAAAPEHVFENIGQGVCDQAKCACGWKGIGFWDAADLAWDNWCEHVADTFGLIPKECPCGKKYISADGGKPCHELRSV